ncbi:MULTISPECIES: L-histidine N(alpha)-methyltransferase [unclassified Pseudoalteromonas]|uniref:L-histidine N(alpha)-methyltransferase n=1 Tax=unclassified Pseudoalteromonas TaxID=194690 RepID=UPI00040545B4|nr:MULTISPECIES: L-histidine N(alpha)-methyltransferase [unclassified Pseudoalteromonas]MDC9497744.1 L-histidine N(alpha)-methyltransferase [Pseudoalteromonas sp. Angola-20]MDC9517151.1 L-histidine N(alpha)-methyltransferase [Pseudoalteromonas sp. Angola-22]MDC9533582.1 L-histidine N(alpha)-methyltransferase [Pseudoalteromonas sp. Angola-9]TMP83410.1 L-histidine N(alpha)-methyltransferase [Pseudoalteromonas sp. S983]
MSQVTAINQQSITDLDFLNDVLHGLAQQQKSLPCKYFYDDKGAALFEQITSLQEYYVTRTELAILEGYSKAIANRLPENLSIIEPGCGSGKKVAYLLAHMSNVKTFVPFEISSEMLNYSLAHLSPLFPELAITPLLGDFTHSQMVKQLTKDTALDSQTNLVYFPGSTLGNFAPVKAIEIMNNFHRLCGVDGYVLIGIDLVKERQVLLDAYDDKAGITAAFNKNLLQRINNELNGTFILDNFKHESRFNEVHSRIEMHLVSKCNQSVVINDKQIDFVAGESIHTENSHKYTLESFKNLAAQANLSLEQTWQDEKSYFALCLLRPM